jgi:hypothetical protein
MLSASRSEPLNGGSVGERRRSRRSLSRSVLDDRGIVATFVTSAALPSSLQ